MAELYERAGVLSEGRVAPLHEACRHCAKCWADEEPDARPAPDSAGIALPWIGRDYGGDRIAVAGINLYEYGGLFAQWWIYQDVQEMMATFKRYKGSMLPYAVGTYVSALLHRDGPDQFREPSALDAAKAWERIAFMELVKCSPARGRSAPNEQMWANCLGTYFLDELHLLEPRSLIVMGTGMAAEHVALLPGISGWRREHGIHRGFLDLDGHSVDVFCCYHPAYGGWRASIPPLLAVDPA